MTTVFQNKTILPLECISTFGVSAKETDSPIGYFGTGLKYAIATLLRESCLIVIFIDNQKYEFTTEQKAVRSKEFGFIYMNGEQLPFTTELGRNWKLWQAYRELYSNCIDEGGTVVSGVDSVDEECAGGTIIMVSGLEEIHSNSGDFVLRSIPKHTLDNVEVHESEKPGIFYKGIKVLDLPTKYSYNVLHGLTLTEDRTVCQYGAEYAITSAIVGTDDTDALIDILSITDEKYHEAKFNWSRYTTPSESFMRLAATLKEKSHALNTYYLHYEAKFFGKMPRSALSESITKKLNKLRASQAFKPKEIFVAAMSDDYKIIDEGLVLNIELLSDNRALNFVYRLACHKIKSNAQFSTDYCVIKKHMLGDFVFLTQRQKKIRNSAPRKAA